jgi:hypothetical protein
MLQKAKEEPKTATVDLMTAFCKETAAPALRGRAGALKAMERKIQRHKTKALDHPKRPVNYDDLVALPEKFKQTSAGDRFLIFNKVIGSAVQVESTQEATQGTSTSGGGKGGARMIGYASNFGLHLLRQAEVWSADGTFSVTPVPFYQLYTILAHLDGYAYPAAFVFLPGKKRYMYKVCNYVSIRKYFIRKNDALLSLYKECFVL